MKELLSKHKYGILLIIPGLIAGFLYWKYVGCVSCTCPLTSNWHTTVLFGGFIVYFLGDSADDMIKKRKKSKNDSEL
ncbi:MAG: hypothetical protein C0597_01205 [Marinilabiliales bacterium]|nr:MAG: hypothetical protein C0597_01205 [Marinilabiliales bacterium]